MSKNTKWNSVPYEYKQKCCKSNNECFHGTVGFEFQCDSETIYSLEIIPSLEVFCLRCPDQTILWAWTSNIRGLTKLLGQLEGGKVLEWIARSIQETNWYYYALTTNNCTQ